MIFAPIVGGLPQPAYRTFRFIGDKMRMLRCADVRPGVHLLCAGGAIKSGQCPMITILWYFSIHY